VEGRPIVIHFFNLGPLLSHRHFCRHIRDGDIVVTVSNSVRHPIGKELIQGRWVHSTENPITHRYGVQRIKGETLGASLHVAVGALFCNLVTGRAHEVLEKLNFFAERTRVGDKSNILDFVDTVEARRGEFFNILFTFILGKPDLKRTSRFPDPPVSVHIDTARAGRCCFRCGGGTCRIFVYFSRIGRKGYAPGRSRSRRPRELQPVVTFTRGRSGRGMTRRVITHFRPGIIR